MKKTIIIKKDTVIGTEWFESLVEEIEATRVETMEVAYSTLLKGKYDIGEMIAKTADHQELPVTALVQLLVGRIKVSEREIFHCLDYYRQYEKILKSPDYRKAISWNGVKKIMASFKKGRDENKACNHKHVMMIAVCEDCGKRVNG